jgi:hypothetical protein
VIHGRAAGDCEGRRDKAEPYRMAGHRASS